MEMVLRLSGFQISEVGDMDDIQVYRRYFVAAEFWKSLIGSVTGKSAPSIPTPNMTPSPQSNFSRGSRQSAATDTFNFPSGV